jgi:NAD(P)-dependent dehydrogenase (short-subunit alcohol dehydrogenase family)
MEIRPRNRHLRTSSAVDKYGNTVWPTGGILTTVTTTAFRQRPPELLGQTVVVIGGSAGIGLETARRARAEGASVILTGRNSERLKQAALELDAQRTAAFDVNDPASLQSFLRDLPTPIDHIMVTAGAAHYGPPSKSRWRRRDAASPSICYLRSRSRVAPPTRSGRGSLVFMGGTGARRP